MTKIKQNSEGLAIIPEKDVKLTESPGEFFWLSKMRDRTVRLFLLWMLCELG
ncbi:MAG: hypothetical protein V7K71_22945 [Nostoc sp.]|uniref:hypothetical protein n=1 Tax=Nostoc sp. TaxID=1180 RepID=UPI002FFCBD8C